MRAVEWAAVAVAVLSAISALAGYSAVDRTVELVSSASADAVGDEDTPSANSRVDERVVPCPAGFLPDYAVCVPFPAALEAHRVVGDGSTGADGSGSRPSSPWQPREQIPRYPDRPQSYGAYVYPVDLPDGLSRLSAAVVRGYDSQQPGSLECRAANSGEGRSRDGLAGDGHGGVDVAASRGAVVRAMSLRGQIGETRVVFVGSLVGKSVVTLHRVDEGGRVNEYLVISGCLDGAGLTDAVGSGVAPGVQLGLVGDSCVEGREYLHLEVRQVRDGVDVAGVGAASVGDAGVSIVCDPRNVLSVVDGEFLVPAALSTGDSTPVPDVVPE